jgi:outer membrane protein TolC
MLWRKMATCFKKRGDVFSLVASLGFFLALPATPSFSQQLLSSDLFQKPGWVGEARFASSSAETPPVLVRKIADRQDLTPPSLVEISVKAFPVNVRTGLSTITVTAHLQDDMAGVKEWKVVFTNAAGDHSFQVSGNPGLISGTLQDGTFEGIGIAPPDKVGRWEATSITLVDATGNTASLKPEERGFHLSFNQEPSQKGEELPVQRPPAEAPPLTLGPPKESVVEGEGAVTEPPPQKREEAPGEKPSAPPPSQKVEEAPIERPLIRLTLKEAIRTALSGNRPYLDRLDSMRQRFGLGQVTTEQIFTVPSLTGASIAEVRIPGAATGLAGAQAQFETTLNPFVSINRRTGGLASPEDTKTYGIGLGKKFTTGGILTMDVSSLTPLSFGQYDANTLNLSFTQPLLRGAWPLVVNEPVVSAKSDLLKEELSVECCDVNSRQKLMFDVISQYSDIKNQLELVQIAKMAVERAIRLFKATEAKVKVDLATQLDLSRAEIQLSTQARSLNRAVQDFATKEENFKILLGLGGEERIELTDPIVYEPSEAIKAEDLSKFIEIATRNRPDLRAEEIRVEDADRKLKIARRDYLPDLSFNATETVSNLGGLDALSEANKHNWSTSLTLRYPLPLTTQRVNIDQNVVALRRGKRLLVERREGMIKDVRTDLINAVKGQEQIEIAKAEIVSAEKKLKIANFRFDRGLASNFDVVDAENNLIQARQNLTQTIVNYLVARNKLALDMGVLKFE